jgi:hypothetical protein
VTSPCSIKRARPVAWPPPLPGRRALPLLLAIALGAAWSGSAAAQLPLLPDEVERVDVIAIERDGRELYGFDALTGARARVRLEIDETVLFQRSRGRVGLVLTDKRALGVASGTAWLEVRWRIHEVPAQVALVEERLGLTVTSWRALAFTARGWVEESLTPSEVVSTMRAGSGAGVVTTNRRLLGVGPSSGFVSEKLRLREVLESVTTQDTIITLRTDLRILIFSAPRASWREEKLRLQ